MRWLLRGLAVLVVLVLAVFALFLATGMRTTRPVGFQLVQVPDPGGPPLETAIWYPATGHARPVLLGLGVEYVVPNGPLADGRPRPDLGGDGLPSPGLPLVVISHGNGGGSGSHADTALALAQAGFVVAAPTHTGDNYADDKSVGRPKWLIDRSRHIKSTIDYMLGAWPRHGFIDPDRIGVFGFSAGATTALIAIGGAPDLARIAPFCAAHKEIVCQLWTDKGPPPSPNAFVHDPRVKAAVVAAPGFGFTLAPGGLGAVHVPVQLWSGTADVNVPYAANTGPVREALGPLAEFHSAPGAGHFSFLAPCGPIGPPPLCRDGAGFDRKAFHEEFNGEVVWFFENKLKAR